MSHNMYSLKGVQISDEEVAKLYGIDTSTVETPSINFEIFEAVRKRMLMEDPDDYEAINEKIDNEIFWLKRNLASKGLLE